MDEDEIVEEIHRIREEHAKSLDYDLNAMFADWQAKQNKSDRKVVNLKMKPNSTTSKGSND